MARKNLQGKSRRSSDIWVYVSICFLTAFTVFVLLDTFAIARVQQVAQAADFSSIVAAREASSTDSDDMSNDADNQATESESEATSDNAVATDASSESSEANASSSGSSSRSHGKH